ncbi:hypothetical protein [Agromyces bauzanensis]
MDRVPARAVAPVPAVDAGILVMAQRTAPLVPVREGGAYRALVRRVYAAPGHGAVAMAAHVVGRSRARAWSAAAGVGSTALTRTVTADQWAALHRIAGATA